MKEPNLVMLLKIGFLYPHERSVGAIATLVALIESYRKLVLLPNQTDHKRKTKKET